jgi:hypothetical protein
MKDYTGIEKFFSKKDQLNSFPFNKNPLSKYHRKANTQALRQFISTKLLSVYLNVNKVDKFKKIVQLM